MLNLLHIQFNFGEKTEDGRATHQATWATAPFAQLFFLAIVYFGPCELKSGGNRLCIALPYNFWLAIVYFFLHSLPYLCNVPLTEEPQPPIDVCT